MIAQVDCLSCTPENIWEVSEIQFRDNIIIVGEREISDEEDAYRFIAEVFLGFQGEGSAATEMMKSDALPAWGRRRLQSIQGPAFLEFSLPAEYRWLPAYLADVIGVIQHCSGRRFARYTPKPSGEILFFAE